MTIDIGPLHITCDNCGLEMQLPAREAIATEYPTWDARDAIAQLNGWDWDVDRQGNALCPECVEIRKSGRI